MTPPDELTPDCPHGEYTLVTGAQTSVLALQITVFGVKCTKCGKQWDMGDMMTAPARIEALERAAKEYADAVIEGTATLGQQKRLYALLAQKDARYFHPPYVPPYIPAALRGEEEP